MAAPSVAADPAPGKRKAAALISQNRCWDMWNERTKSPCPATVFFSPSGRINLDHVLNNRKDR